MKARRLVLTLLTYLLSLAGVAGLVFLIVILLAGPHAGLLPAVGEAVVLILGWLAVILLPVWSALRVWRRTGRP